MDEVASELRSYIKEEIGDNHSFFEPYAPGYSSTRTFAACLCVDCLLAGPSFTRYNQNQCRLAFCTFVGFGVSGKGGSEEHERSHFGQSGKYTCAEPGCHTTTKKFSDLKRHYAGRHCIDPKKAKFPCPVLDCKYSGDNGFARKDKLKSPYKNVHERKLVLPCRNAEGHQA